MRKDANKPPHLPKSSSHISYTLKKLTAELSIQLELLLPIHRQKSVFSTFHSPL